MKIHYIREKDFQYWLCIFGRIGERFCYHPTIWLKEENEFGDLTGRIIECAGTLEKGILPLRILWEI